MGVYLKQICAFFFTQTEPRLASRASKCRIYGYTNLISHLAAKHPTHGEEFTEFQRRNLTSFEVFGFVDQDTSEMYDWLHWVMARNLPFSEVEDPLTRRRVGNTIATEVDTAFGLMFDSWMSGTYHYVAVFALYHGTDSHCERLIGLSPMVDGFTADAHIQYVEAILGVYDKSVDMIKFLVGDNCSTNQSFASKLKVSLVGCASRRFT
ncbi:hypothetical protein BBJ28_00017352 [Nothophytophthora sp. Chile5]|nr:hypothetical protein BBJ28_00017352 [Nothophytophthora sp. Chile5]